jgi:hypothetical protein
MQQVSFQNSGIRWKFGKNLKNLNK